MQFCVQNDYIQCNFNRLKYTISAISTFFYEINLVIHVPIISASLERNGSHYTANASDSPVQSANWKWLCSASQSCFYCICNDLSFIGNQSNCTKRIWEASATVILNDDKDSLCVKAHYSTDHKKGLLYDCVNSVVLTEFLSKVGRPTKNFTFLYWFLHLLVAESTLKLD